MKKLIACAYLFGVLLSAHAQTPDTIVNGESTREELREAINWNILKNAEQEDTINQIRSQASSNALNITTNVGNINGNSAAITANDGEISDLQDTTLVFRDSLDNYVGDISDNATLITVHDAKINTNISDVETNSAGVNLNVNNISDLNESVEGTIGWTIEITDDGDSVQFTFGTNTVKVATGSSTVEDVTVPYVVGAEVGNLSADTMVWTMSENCVDDSIPATSAFTITTSLGDLSAAVDNVYINGDTIKLTLDSSIIENEVVSVSYTKPSSGKIQDVSGNELSSFTNQSVSTNIQPTSIIQALYLFENNLDNEASRVTLVESESGLMKYNNNTDMQGEYNINFDTHYHLKSNDTVTFNDEWTVCAYIDAGGSVQRGIFSVDNGFRAWMDYTDDYIETSTGPVGGPTGSGRSVTLSGIDYDSVFVCIRCKNTGGTYYLSTWASGINKTNDSIVGQDISSMSDTFRLGYVFAGGEGFSDMDAWHYYDKSLTDAEMVTVAQDPGIAVGGDAGDPTPPSSPYAVCGLGNSIVNSSNEAYDLLGDMSDYNMTNLAGAGDKISDQIVAWNTLTSTQKQALDFILVMPGINDIASDSDPLISIKADYESLINFINGSTDAEIIAFTLTPARSNQYISSQDYAEWLHFNTWMEDTLINADLVSTTNTVDLADGSNNLAAAYDSGDGLHPNSAGQSVILQNLIDGIADFGTEVLFTHDFDNLGLLTRGNYNPESDGTWHSADVSKIETINNLAIVSDGTDTVFAHYYDQGHSGHGSNCDPGGGNGVGTYFVGWINSGHTGHNDIYLSYNLKTTADFYVGVYNQDYMEMKYPGLEATVFGSTGASVRLKYSNWSTGANYIRWYNKLYGDSYSATENYVGDYNDTLNTTGTWQNFTMRISVNTTGNADGFIEFFYNGVLVGSETGLEITNNRSIDKIEFSTATGGCLQSLQNMENDHVIYYDDFTVWKYAAGADVPHRGEPSAVGRVLAFPDECDCPK